MEMTFNQTLIFVPMLVVVVITIIGFLRMVQVRIKTIGGRQVPLKYYVAFQGAAEPEATAVAVRHYANVFEAPIIFYVACFTVFLLGAGSEAIYITAWVYAIARTVQSVIHLSYNNVRHRAIAFSLGWLALIALWVQTAMALFAKI